jgi:hypothetical protein
MNNKPAWIVIVIMVVALIIGLPRDHFSIPKDVTGITPSPKASVVARPDPITFSTSPPKAVITTIMVPEDSVNYEKTMRAFFWDGTTKIDPVPSLKFIPKKVVTFSVNADPIVISAQAAAEQIYTQARQYGAQIAYFKIQNSTAYVLLVIDFDGWAGSGYFEELIQPIVTKTLLQYPGITSVKFTAAPGDPYEPNMPLYAYDVTDYPKNYMRSYTNDITPAAWSGFADPTYNFSIKYPLTTQVISENTEEGKKFTLQLTADKKVAVDIASRPITVHDEIEGNIPLQPNCNEHPSGGDPDYYYVNGVRFMASSISRELSTGTSGYYGVGIEYCTLKNGVSYRIIPQIRYVHDTAAPKISDDPEFAEIIASFKFTN